MFNIVLQYKVPNSFSQKKNKEHQIYSQCIYAPFDNAIVITVIFVRLYELRNLLFLRGKMVNLY